MIVKKHPLAIRWLHWIHFPIMAIMVWSGLLIYWANDVYKIKIGDRVIYKFFGEGFYEKLGIPHRLAEGMSLHFLFMWFFFFNGIAYVVFLFISKEYRLIFPNKKSLRESLLVVLHDLHIRKGLPPQKKYNAAQRVAYTMVIIMGGLMLVTGLSIYKPVQFHWLVALCGGYEWARAEHFIITLLLVLFFVVHILQVMLAGWNNFQSMVTGFEWIKKKKEIKSSTLRPGESTGGVEINEPDTSSHE